MWLMKATMDKQYCSSASLLDVGTSAVLGFSLKTLSFFHIPVAIPQEHILEMKTKL